MLMLMRVSCEIWIEDKKAHIINLLNLHLILRNIEKQSCDKTDGRLNLLLFDQLFYREMEEINKKEHVIRQVQLNTAVGPDAKVENLARLAANYKKESRRQFFLGFVFFACFKGITS